MSLNKRQITLRFPIVILKDCQIPLEKLDRLIWVASKVRNMYKTKSSEVQLSSVPDCRRLLPFHIDALACSQGIQAGQDSVTRHLHILH